MASKFLRRSGIAVGLVAEVLEWRADLIVQAGVGLLHEETDVLAAEWPGVQFVGFEPCSDSFRGLQGKYPGELIGRAVGEKSGVADLHVKWNHKDGSSLHPHEAAYDAVLSVPVVTLGEFFAGRILPPRVLLWLDCEGAELAALSGAGDFLNHVQVVNVELTSRRTWAGWASPVDVHRLLADAGFFKIWIHTQRISAGQYDAIYVRKPLFRPEFCCCPYEVERWQLSTD